MFNSLIRKFYTYDVVTLNVGVGGKNIGVDKIAGVDYELVKMAFGAENVLTPIDAANPLPVTDAVSEAALTFIAAQDFATQSTLLDILNKLLASIAVTGTFWQATQPVSGIVAVTGAGDASAANQVTGNTSIASIKTNTDNLATPTAVLNGKTTVTTAGTRVTLAASTAVKSVTIKAALANTGTIYVGNSTVAASNGFELAAGETISLEISNLNTVNIDSSINSQSVTYIAIN